jgi:hypothetical protein
LIVVLPKTFLLNQLQHCRFWLKPAQSNPIMKCSIRHPLYADPLDPQLWNCNGFPPLQAMMMASSPHSAYLRPNHTLRPPLFLLPSLLDCPVCRRRCPSPISIPFRVLNRIFHRQCEERDQ